MNLSFLISAKRGELPLELLGGMADDGNLQRAEPLDEFADRKPRDSRGRTSIRPHWRGQQHPCWKAEIGIGSLGSSSGSGISCNTFHSGIEFRATFRVRNRSCH